MDEGLPIAYEVLDSGVPVYTSDGDSIGTVDHVISAERQDIFHGIVIRVGTDRRFVAADQIASLHERGVDLRSMPPLPRSCRTRTAHRVSGGSASPE